MSLFAHSPFLSVPVPNPLLRSLPLNFYPPFQKLALRQELCVHTHVNAYPCTFHKCKHKHRVVGDSDDMVKIRRSLNTQMGFRRNTLHTQILQGRQHPGGSSTSKTDEKTTKLLVAVSDKLWQSVLQGQQPAIIAHSMDSEFEDLGSRPTMLDLYDYDRFVKNMCKITDGGDERPTKVPEDEAKQCAHEPPAVQEALTWQV